MRYLSCLLDCLPCRWLPWKAFGKYKWPAPRLDPVSPQCEWGKSAANPGFNRPGPNHDYHQHLEYLDSQKSGVLGQLWPPTENFPFPWTSVWERENPTHLKLYFPGDLNCVIQELENTQEFPPHSLSGTWKESRKLHQMCCFVSEAKEFFLWQEKKLF